MPSLLTQKRALQVSTWSLLCLGLVPSGGKALLGGTIAQLQVAHNPKRSVLQSIHLLSDPCCWEVEKADCRLQCHSFITISYMILILSSLLQRALLLRVSEVRCFQYARSICCIGCAWPSCLKRFENDACGQNKLGVMLWKPTETGQKVTKRILTEQKQEQQFMSFTSSSCMF